jgi:hypothetical protein
VRREGGRGSFERIVVVTFVLPVYQSLTVMAMK